jgi:aminocarboxymuconate-semialdehyde decarboxylase
MAGGMARVTVETINDLPDSITVNGMPVGATVEQLAEAGGILAAMDRAGLDRRVLTPPPFTYRYWDEAEPTASLCRLLNDELARLVSAHPQRLVGLATVPLQDPGLAAAEMGRALDDLGLAGIGVGTNVGGRLLSDPSLRPFFRAVAERGAPILVHPEFVPSPRYPDYYLINLLGMPVETGTTVANMILTGMLEELGGELRICFVHGGGVAPALWGRWSHSWKARADTRRDSALPPVEQLGSIYWDSLTHSPQVLSLLVEMMGADHVVIGTDAPFDMEDASPRGTLRAAPRLTEEEVIQIESRTPLVWLYGPAATTSAGGR